MSLKTSWETRAAAGEPPATVRVNNLTTTTFVGPADAWGRPSRPQPLSISAEVAFSRRFSASSLGDVVEADTVHYGLLSKEIQRILADGVEGPSLANMLDEVIWRLTGWRVLEEEGAAGTVGQPFLMSSPVLYVGVEIRLPKASLLGDGVSIAGLALMPTDGRAAPRAKSVTLRFHNLRVPTLIGVNANEREAEQMVVANIEVDRWVDRADGYSPLGRVITKAMRDSSFETLEALATELCLKIDVYLRSKYPLPDTKGWRLRVSLEKPIAVPLADAPCVQLSVDTCDLKAPPSAH